MFEIVKWTIGGTALALLLYSIIVNHKISREKLIVGLTLFVLFAGVMIALNLEEVLKAVIIAACVWAFVLIGASLLAQGDAS